MPEFVEKITLQGSKPESIRIRAALPADWQAVRGLLASAGLPTEDLGEDRLDEFLIAECPQTQGLPALGLIGLECFGEFGLLRSLVVSKPARGRGLGQKLVRSLERKAHTANVAELWLLTIDADAFFASVGYRVADRQSAPDAICASREFSELCPADAVLMQKSLVGNGQ